MQIRIIAVYLIMLVLTTCGCSKDAAIITISGDNILSSNMEILINDDIFILAGNQIWQIDNHKAQSIVSNIYYRGVPQAINNDIYYINAYDMDRLYKFNTLDRTNVKIANVRCVDFFVYKDSIYCATLDGDVLKLSPANNVVCEEALTTNNYVFRHLIVNQDQLYGYDKKLRCICRYIAEESRWENIESDIYTDKFVSCESGVFFISNADMTLCRISPDMNSIENLGMNAILLYSDGKTLYYVSEGILYCYNGTHSTKCITLNCNAPKGIIAKDGVYIYSKSDGQNQYIYIVNQDE